MGYNLEQSTDETPQAEESEACSAFAAAVGK
jgi:hypothetical protein